MGKNSSKIKLSIVCTTYNQENYIAKALDSFLMQETDFPFEVIVGEDCSSDKTRTIVEDYAKKYPDIIKPIYQEKNSGGYQNIVDAMNACKGEYIILNEGDDFFTDKNKLQIQVDYLDKHKDCSMCFHPVKVFFQDKSQKDYIFPTKEILSKIKHHFDYNSLKKGNFIQTNSCMYRRDNINFEQILPPELLPGDWFIHLHYSKLGKIGYIDKVMSAYRRCSTGIWQLAYTDPDKHLLKYWKPILNFYIEGEKKFKDDRKFWLKKAAENYKNIYQICTKNQEWDILLELIKSFSNLDQIIINSDLEKARVKKFKNRCILLQIIIACLFVLTALLLKKLSLY